jgi:hypothetical protein
LGSERETIRLFNGLKAKVDVKLGPVEVAWGWLLHRKNPIQWLVLEPRKVLIREEQLLVSGQEPDTMGRDVGYFNARNA